MSKHRIGLVATGGIARSHIRSYRLVLAERAEVVAACDPNPETLHRFCDTYGIAARYATAKEMIGSGGVDVIAVLTPPVVRREVLLPAFEAGVHVLVEKPFTESLADAVEFVQRAENAGVQLAVNQNMRFLPEIDALRAVLAEGWMGRVHLCAHDHFQRRTTVDGWRAREERLEIAIFSIHILDRLRWLLGVKPLAVSAVTRAGTPPLVEGDLPRGEMFTQLTVQFEGGAVGTMISSWLSRGLPECRIRVDGDGGSLLAVKPSWAAPTVALSIFREGCEPEERTVTVESASLRSYGRSMGALLDAIESGEPAVNSGRDNLHTMEIVDGAYLSAARGGALVRVADLLDSAGQTG
ncbi:MAG: Gfo/Idh/MocA family oxidoreductase [Armatimonadetes bacterium]|nr:Gfo/Idh/MocA family oxidoreductase [Armatimonadota bacterium]